jgi:hypothetical protein
MPTRDFYTLPEAAQILEVPQRSLLKSLEAGVIEGERHPSFGGTFSSPEGLEKVPGHPRFHSARRLATKRYVLLG